MIVGLTLIVVVYLICACIVNLIILVFIQVLIGNNTIITYAQLGGSKASGVSSGITYYACNNSDKKTSEIGF